MKRTATRAKSRTSSVTRKRAVGTAVWVVVVVGAGIPSVGTVVEGVVAVLGESGS